MSGLIITALVILVFIVIYQISKAGELAMALRGEKEAEAKTNKLMAWLMVITFILGLWGIWECHEYLMPMMLPESASEHGDNYDLMLKITLIMNLLFRLSACFTCFTNKSATKALKQHDCML